ncbi:MAG: polysaccharide deacetylase family protein [Fimbriimonadaceae bacterium]|nr:polysaccharide deacetylase family protein [Fimbriimonadaceae bacterium]
MKFLSLFVLVLMGSLILGQNSKLPVTDQSHPTVVQPKQATTPRVTNRPGNRLGTVLVLMYHRTGPDEKFMVRSHKRFREDLERLYRLGYRPVTLAEYSLNKMPLPRGASPVVMTFDDSHPSQFALLPDGTIDPNCMIGIWQEFAKKHPDFPIRGTFFVLPNGPFGQKKLSGTKLGMLKKWGCEIGSHTMTHRLLGKLTDQEVKKELGDSYLYVQKLGFEPTSLALPYGGLPTNRELTVEFEYEHSEYSYINVCLAGSEPAPSPLAKNFNRTRIPRVQAYDGTYGIKFWLDENKKHPSKPYVQP